MCFCEQKTKPPLTLSMGLVEGIIDTYTLRQFTFTCSTNMFTLFLTTYKMIHLIIDTIFGLHKCNMTEKKIFRSFCVIDFGLFFSHLSRRDNE